MSESLKQKVRFNAPASTIYRLLMDPKKHAAFTGEKATMINKVGGRFTSYGSYISGINLELKPGRRIVQAWRGSDFPPGEYSIVKYELTPVHGGCELEFTQLAIPKGFAKDLKQGWIQFYWDKIKEYLTR